GLVDREGAERRDATRCGDGGGAAERPAARVGADRQGDVARVGRDEVRKDVFDPYRDGGTDRHTGDGVGRLLEEREVIGRCGRDVERARGRAGERGAAGRGERVAGEVGGERGREGGCDATRGGDGGGAAEDPAARIRRDRERHVARVARHEVRKCVLDADRDRRGDRHAGDGVGRLLEERQVVGRCRCDVERAGGGAGERGAAGRGERVAG